MNFRRVAVPSLLEDLGRNVYDVESLVAAHALEWTMPFGSDKEKNSEEKFP